MKVLFVCHGNINRSAAGEIMLKQIKPEWEVKSAALKDTKGGERTAKKMRETLVDAGYPGEIRSTPISQQLIDWADVIFYMDDSNHNKLKDKFGDSVFEKAIRISNYVSGVTKIPDPNFAKGTEMHKEVIKLLEIALHKYINEQTV
jgi:protein-tyrosine phosphatase